MAHGQGATSGRTPRSRGAYGSTRGKERQKRRADNREKDPRYQKAMEETRAAQEALDKLIDKQQRKPAVGVTAGAKYAEARREAEEKLAAAAAAEQEAKAEQAAAAVADGLEAAFEAGRQFGTEINKRAAAKKFSTKRLRQNGDGDFQFALTTARMMLRQGYNIKYVIEFTGVGYLQLDDIPIDEDGFGVRVEDEEEV